MDELHVSIIIERKGVFFWSPQVLRVVRIQVLFVTQTVLRLLSPTLSKDRQLQHQSPEVWMPTRGMWRWTKQIHESKADINTLSPFSFIVGHAEEQIEQLVRGGSAVNLRGLSEELVLILWVEERRRLLSTAFVWSVRNQLDLPVWEKRNKKGHAAFCKSRIRAGEGRTYLNMTQTRWWLLRIMLSASGICSPH